MIMLFQRFMQKRLVPIKVLKYDSSNHGNGLAVCPDCKEELFGNNYEWKCKSNHEYQGPVK